MKKFHAFILILLLAVVAGCSSSNSDAPVVGGSGSSGTNPHPANWKNTHSTTARGDLRGCQGCHGFDFAGSGNAISCLGCHPDAPNSFIVHPSSWNGNPVQGHQDNFQSLNPEQWAWTRCAECHGAKLEGDIGPTCKNASCHTTDTGGWPPAPTTHVNYNLSSNHGPAAKGKTTTTINMGNNCFLCHGSGSNSFDGGFVFNPAIMNISGTNCSASVCHPDAGAHPADWIPANNSIFHSDGSLNSQTQSEGCALCHNIAAASPAGPNPAAPSCYSASFQTQACHPGGPGSAPHAVPFAESLHGPAAKADLVYCQSCHADTGTAGTTGVAGSNPRFNIAKGSMAQGCESAGCHAANSAHPVGVDRWTFNKDATFPVRRTHFAAGLDSGGGRDLTACSMCHDATSGAGDNAGLRTGCATNCHLSLGASGPSAGVSCTYCHLESPDGVADLTGGAGVNHLFGGSSDISAEPLHENCSLCHGASQNGATGLLVAKNANYDLTLGNTSQSYQGGDHLDGNLEMNGPVGTGTGYNPATFTCTQTCHGTEVGHVLTDSTLTIENGNYGAGDCSSCHGYPPDGTGGSTNHLAANRSRAGGGSGSTNAAFYSAHGLCSTCHGLAGDTDPSVSTASNFGTPITLSGSGGDDYVIANMHNKGSVQMNGAGGANAPYTENAGYNSGTGGCADACHAADWVFSTRKSTPVNTIDLREFGAGNCTACHGYPPVTSSHTRHAGGGTDYSYDCQVCHPASTAPTHNEGGGTVNIANVQVTLPGFGNIPAGGTFNSGTKVCSNTYCHGSANAGGPTWDNGPNEALCGSCHGAPGSGRPNGVDASGTYHSSIANHASAACTDCHTHDGSNLTEHANGPADANGDALVSNAGAQITTHSYGGSTLATDANGFDFTASTCTTSCHGTGTWGSASGTGGACDACHDAGGAGTGPNVSWKAGTAPGKTTSFGSHLKKTTGDSPNGSTDWALQCMSCHPGHEVLIANKQVLIPLPPTSWDNNNGDTGLNMQTRLGIDYAQSGSSHGGINLGGSATTSSFANAGTPTEAEICWGCHGAGPANDAVNEWGYNVDSSGGSFPATDLALDTPPAGANTTPSQHNYGWIYSDVAWATPTADWTGTNGLGAYRRDAYQHGLRGDKALSRQIASTHSVNFDPIKQDSSVDRNLSGGTVQHNSLEARADLRCSYCHDVHDLNKAMSSTDTASGRPYLRGTWSGNLYGADVPPLSGTTYGNTNKYPASNGKTFSAATPRLLSNSAASKQKGGYFIDANSSRPTTNTSFDTIAETAGLCTLCHGTTVDTMDYYKGSSLWRTDIVLAAGNGHANSTLGGTGAADTTHARDIFDARRGGSVQVMANQVALPVSFRYGETRYDGVAPFSSSMQKAHDTGTRTAPANTGWYGGTVNSQTPGSQYGTWYGGGIGHDNSGSGRAHSFTCSKCHSPHATGLPALLITNCLDKSLASWTAAGGNVTPSTNQSNNCHRKESTSTGWNRLGTSQ